MEEIKSLDLVALLADLPEQGLRRGAVGTVLEQLKANGLHPAGWIVEFVSFDGKDYVEADITDAARMMKLNFQRLAA